MLKKYTTIVISLGWASVLFSATSVPYDHTNEQLFKNSYGIASIRLQEEHYQAPMAHPSVGIRTINVDTKAQRILNFTDLFTDEEKALKIIAAYSKTYFMEKLAAENLPQENFAMRAEFIKTGTAPTLKNYQHWNIISGYLQIAFDRAQVEPSYFGVPTIDVPLSLLTEVLNKKLFPNLFQLKPGDLLFQDLACGELCDGINSTTYGYKDTTVSHVGMVVSVTEPMVIEAVSAGVKFTPLDTFLVRSLDKSAHPRVMVGRVDAQTQALIPSAIKEATHYLGSPYNSTFSPNAQGFYCSQLITRSFLEANNNKPVFALHPMNFKTDQPHEFSPAWVHYFAELKQPIPQGKPGNNPGMLSRDPKIKIVYFYGDLRQK